MVQGSGAWHGIAQMTGEIVHGGMHPVNFLALGDVTTNPCATLSHD